MKVGVLYWCVKCNVPLLTDRCDLCRQEVIRKVKITPPGNVKPMFEEERRRIQSTIHEQYGDHVTLLSPDDRIVLLNKVPHVDLAYEVIVDGQVIGLWRFDVESMKYHFIPHMEGARRMAKQRARKWILADRGAEKAITLEGKNLLAAGVEDHDDIRDGDFVYVVNEDWKAIAVGKVSHDFKRKLLERRGMVVKVKHFDKPRDPEVLESKATWSDAVLANKCFLEEKEREAMNLVQTICHKVNKPILVSFSGGKDSLATLIIVKKALESLSREFYVLFSDTKIEYPETTKYVEETLRKLGLEGRAMKVDAFTNFFDAIEVFGPPARDFRWCCKTCKLAPIAYVIKSLGGECLTFIGLREVESARRKRQGAIWEGIWIKGQTGVSPIYDWRTLDIWLYLFKEGVEVNPLYYKGLERIGCWTCPSMDLAEMQITEEIMNRSWQEYLGEISEKLSLKDHEVKLGLWRWRFRRPGWLKTRTRMVYKDYFQYLREVKELYLKREDDFRRIVSILKTLYDVREEEGRVILVEGKREIARLTRKDRKITIEICDGSRKRHRIKIFRGIARAITCVKCRLCIAVCPNNAISLRNDGIEIASEYCVACGECNYTCPVWAYSPRSPYIAKRLLELSTLSYAESSQQH
ncbi:MAG: phosphoadenosine phosphosulfate reductase family protein [Candidatus Nezhaarchaeales archaeon]